jgi:6,7-dimethyl-8-ribityllumazine synthase
MLTPVPARPRLAVQTATRIAIVASRYNAEFVDAMLAKTKQELRTIDPVSRVDVVYAPGSFEIPYLARILIERQKPDVIICLGVIIQGETGHADLIATSVSNALCQISVETKTPIIHGVLLLDHEEQAQERCLGDEFNRGTEAARAAIELLCEARSIQTR